MAILPIDMQTILGQMNNAGKIQHAIENSSANRQIHQGNLLHQQAAVKNNQVVNLEQTDNEDKKLNPDTEKKQELADRNEQQAKKEKLRDRNTEFFKDPDKGNLIDVKK